MSHGDRMKSKIRGNILFQPMGWVLATVSILLLVAAGGLALFAEQAREQAGVATLLLALFLASWSYVLGIVGLILFPVSWLVASRMQLKQAAMIKFSRTPETRVLEADQFPDPGATIDGPNRSTRHGRDGNQPEQSHQSHMRSPAQVTRSSHEKEYLKCLGS